MARRKRPKFVEGELLPELQIVAQDVWRIFEPRTAERGYRYFQEERVISCGVFSTGKSVHGKVRGNNDKVYEVTIGIYHTKYGGIEGLCSCPMGSDCKHAAALAFHLASDLEKAKELGNALPKNTQYWLDEVKQLIEEENNKPVEYFNKHDYLGYVLVAGRNWMGHRTTFVQPTIARRHKLGGFGAPKSFDFYALRDRKDGLLEDEDTRIIEWFESIRGNDPQPMTELPDDPELCKLLLSKMFATGRTHFKCIHEPALGPGPNIDSTFEWRTDTDAKQSLQVCSINSDITVVWASAPWYFNKGTHEAGFVDLPVSFNLAELLMDAPPVEIAYAETLTSELLNLRLNIPLPALGDSIEVVCPDPTPILFLESTYVSVRASDEDTSSETNKDGNDNETQLLELSQETKLLSSIANSDELSRTKPLPLRRDHWLTEKSAHDVNYALLPLNDETAQQQQQQQQQQDSQFDRQRKLEHIRRAWLTFDYGEDSRLNKGHEEDRYVDDGKTIIVKRNHSFEDNCVKRLLGLRFTHAISVKGKRLHKGMPFEYWTNELSYWLKVMQGGLRGLEEDGWRIDIGSSFKIVKRDDKTEFPSLILSSGTGWFWFEFGVKIDGELFPLMPLLIEMLLGSSHKLSHHFVDSLNENGTVFIETADHRVLALPFERVQGVMKTLIDVFDRDELIGMRGKPKISVHVAQARQMVKDSQVRWTGLGLSQILELSEKFENFTQIDDVETPKLLNAELRDYQKVGLKWLQFLRELELGGILADDMGLGKTVQTIAHILKEKEDGRLDRPCLIVCPTSVLPNWMAELTKFAPSLRALKLHGPDRAELYDLIPRQDLVVTTYPMIFRDSGKLATVPWYLVVLDEAQAIKNYDTKLAKTVSRLQSHHRLCLTGTPLENHLGELWSQYNFLIPGALGDIKTFNRMFRFPIERSKLKWKQKLLSDRIRPFLLRRTKAEVAKELPEKTEEVIRIELEGEQRDVYETIRVGVLSEVKMALERYGFAKAYMVLLEALLRLRQVSCDPRLLKSKSNIEYPPGAKLLHLLDMLRELVDEGRKILLFSNFTSMLDLIQPHLKEMNIPFVELRGTTKDRVTPVETFQQGQVPLFILSLKAGGVGLNLTAADTVIHFDPWWNPAAENQATDRAHRIGQDKKVFVYKLIAAGTVEDQILDLQRRKQSFADAVYAGADPGNLNFSEEDLRELLKPLSPI